jgi:hypothetical protein
MHLSALSKVFYRLLPLEASPLSDPAMQASHVIDAEVILEAADARRVYLSWADSADEYCVGVQDESWFNPGTGTEIDASGAPMWSRLIGKPVDLRHLDTARQILEIRSSEASAYIATFDGQHWGVDTLTVSTKALSIDA